MSLVVFGSPIQYDRTPLEQVTHIMATFLHVTPHPPSVSSSIHRPVLSKFKEGPKHKKIGK